MDGYIHIHTAKVESLLYYQQSYITYISYLESNKNITLHLMSEWIAAYTEMLIIHQFLAANRDL
jgi:hypothetical protein